MKINFHKTVLLFVLSAFIMTACAHTVRLQVERTPTMDTRGIRRIAIMPFSVTSSHNASRETAQYITTTAISRIQGLNYFTLIDSTVVEQLRRGNQSIEGHVDALFTGQLTLVDSKDSSSQGQYRERDGTIRTYTTYTREVEVEFNYYFTRTRDGSLIGPISRRGTARSSGDNSANLASTTTLLRQAVDNQLRLLGQDVAPHTVTENRRLARETSKDRELKRLMKDTESQVKAGNYRIALDSYLGIYQTYRNIAAAQNASILYEALGNTQDAANLMQRVYTETGNLSAQTELSRLNRILADQAAIATGFATTQSRVEIVSAHASGEIRNVLPQNAWVWIFNNAANDSMVAAVIDNITADFIRRGVGIVDRENAALVAAEQKFQLTGSVSDYDIVSIGNAAGATNIVVVGITGTGDMRRLQVRVLNIERGVPILQSDTSDAWRL